MNEPVARQADGERESSLERPSAAGGLPAGPAKGADYRERLRSRRWRAAPLRNPEAERTDPRIAVLVIVAISLLTLVVLVVGYGILGLWSLGG